VKTLKIICILFCVLSLVSGLTGVRSFHASISAGKSVNSSANIVISKNIAFRIYAFLNAILCGAAAYGIHKKVPATWKLGWVVLVVSLLNALVSALSSSLKLPLPDRWIASSAIVIGICAVAIYWGLWWKRKRNYFETPGKSD
jgi:uncharacterized membrane protein